MDLSDLSKLADDQGRGHEFELHNPVTGDGIGVKLTIAGPNSAIARKARDEMEKAVTRHNARKGSGDIPAKVRIRMMDDFLFALVVGWDVKEKGKDIPFTRETFQRLVDAGTWVRSQLDVFAGDRSPYFKAAE